MNKIFRLLILFCISLVFNQTKVLSQNYNYIIKHSLPHYSMSFNIQWAIYIIPDTVLKVTKYFNEDGMLYFEREFVDTSLINKKHVYGFDRNNLETENLTQHKFIKGIDTIYSIFSKNNSYKVLPKEIEKNYKDVTSIDYEDIFLDEIKFSYILGKLREKPINNNDKNYIRVMFCVNKNEYLIIKIDLNGIPKLHFLSSKTNDSPEVIIIERASFVLDNKDVKRIKKQLLEINNISSQSCSRVGQGFIFLIEYNDDDNQYRRFIVSEDCLREKNDINKAYGFGISVFNIYNKYKLYKSSKLIHSD
jgi:hypothetical protein